MAETDEGVIRGLIGSVSEPVFVIIPNRELEDENLVKLFQTLEEVLTKIEAKTECEFDIMVESAGYFGGYAEMVDVLNEDKEVIEGEQDGTENDAFGYPSDETE